MSSNITINIRPSTGQVFQIDIDSEQATVQDMKTIIAEKMDHADPSTLKLVFSGRILKNEDIIKNCKIVNGCTVHVVRSGVNKVPTADKGKSSQQQQSTPTQSTSEPIPPIPPTPSPSNLTGLGGSPFDMQMPNMDPEVMRQMMDSPFMQTLMSNTDIVRSIIMSNPQMKALVEQNPELGHIISDPAFLRQSMEMMRNPELMREMQRNNDRALSNIEAIPGGFNHLRRMYNTFQSPMESAMTPSSTASDEANNERLARELNVESVPENSLNTQALPNPWATSNNTNTNRSSNTTTTPPSNNNNTVNPFAALAAGGANGSTNPLAALLGGGNGNQGNNGLMSLFGQQQQQQQSTQNNQQGSTPFWADPNFIQASMRLQQAMMAGQNNNSNTSHGDNNTQSNLLQQMMMGLPTNPYGAGSFPDFGFQQQQQQPSEPPEVRFRDQLAQLEEMGFSEKSANVRALMATGGNVQAAIEYLLSM
ncbi:Ubiquitin domain-containing protein DSK2b [Choanephora cucurbitarum]|uniref:Ubiquilin n=1 Tax=Choanephora cucurbitarum TaxID=101091 RepID=A0A1C7ND21_9FUNG|nr:Ubiquitin domain-containing protein DSK2b [Choanephora cucurbitarum]